MRDGLLGVLPKDFDVATNARPETVEELFSKTVAVGKAFGVIKVVEADGDIEVATFRQDADYVDGRRPTGVVFSSPKEDAERRDFTVNALFYDPEKDQVHDFTNGVKDLENRILRTVGHPHKRFSEDHLRLLRAARFAAQLGFEIEAETYQAMQELHTHLTGVSQERIREEMTKLLLAGEPLRGLSAAEYTGLLFEVLPELRHLYQEKINSVDQWTLTKAILQKVTGKKPSMEFVWAILLQSVGEPAEVLSRLKFSNKQCESIVQCLRLQTQLASLKSWTRAQTLQFYSNPNGSMALDLFIAFHETLDPDSSVLQGALTLKKGLDEFTSLPAPLVTSEDLLSAGVLPGKELGEILRLAFEAQLNLEFGSKQGALEWLQKRIAQGKATS